MYDEGAPGDCFNLQVADAIIDVVFNDGGSRAVAARWPRLEVTCTCHPLGA
jgi:hypothetical protein